MSLGFFARRQAYRKALDDAILWLLFTTLRAGKYDAIGRRYAQKVHAATRQASIGLVYSVLT